MNTNLLQGTVRGTVEPHKLKQPGSTPGPATSLDGAEFLECQRGLFRAVDWEQERDAWRTRFAVVLTVAIAGWATVFVLLALV